MAERYGEEWKAGLLDPGRRLHGLGVAEFLEDAGLGPRMTMVDYGCGPGFVTLHAAEMVGPEGRVYGLDIHEGMVELTRSRAAEAGLGNVTALQNDGPHAPLPDGAWPIMVTCILVLHYKESRRERQAVVIADVDAAAQARRGRVVVIQWDRPRVLRGDGRPAHGGRPRSAKGRTRSWTTGTG